MRILRKGERKRLLGSLRQADRAIELACQYLYENGMFKVSAPVGSAGEKDVSASVEDVSGSGKDVGVCEQQMSVEKVVAEIFSRP